MFDPVEKLAAFTRFPSVSADPAFQSGMEGARDFIASLLADSGFTVEVVPTPLHPIVLAKRDGDPTWPHVIIYGHYDVQPPDPLNLWQTAPFEPAVRDGRMYGRGAADNKGPLMVHLAAAVKVLRENPDLPLRITFLVEGEEEIGSPSFLPFLQERRRELAADFVLLSDTGSPNAEQIVITTGLRGIVAGEIEVIGPRSDLHSGVHGGAVYNPIQALAELCAGLHGPDGRVNVPGFYDAVLGVEDWEREELSRLGVSKETYRAFLGVNGFFKNDGYSPFELVRFQPTLEFNGIFGGYQGEGSKTVIPSRAGAKFSCRLVPDQDPIVIVELLEKTLRERCPPEVELRLRFGHRGAPYLVVPPGRSNTPADQPPTLARAFATAERAVARQFGKPPLFLREGGSVPIIADFKRELGLDSLMIGLFLPEDNLHAPNESFHLGVMAKGIEVSASILRSVAGAD
ncbi:MAG: M20/M25/M40 family metallo-hydrolase [Puniceicoccaceae bacterium]|nr:MAG: M20/M25/M40 family metallo-hydrolase [Puniceicoccaceae bacterium]